MPTLTTVGFAGSGKTQFLALLYLHLIKMSRTSQRRRDVMRVSVQNETSDFDIRAIASALSNGTPPEKSPEDKVYRAKVTLRVPVVWGDRRITLPLLDVAGEDIQRAMEFMVVGKRKYIRYRELEDKWVGEGKELTVIRDMHDTIFRADAFCFIFDLQREIRSHEGDAKYSQFVQNLAGYRDANGIKRIKAVAFVFTKYDEARDELARMFGGEPTEGQLGNQFAPFTLGEVETVTIHQPKIFKSYTEWEVRPNLDTNGRGKFRTVIDTQSGLSFPDYPEDQYKGIVDWIRDL